MRNKLLSIISVIAFISFNSCKDEFDFVRDFESILTDEQIQLLEEKLSEHQKNTSCQIFIITVSSFEGMSGFDYSMQVMKQLNPGEEGLNNGALILLSKSEQSLEIRFSYAFEQLFSQSASDSIGSVMGKSFAEERIYEGLDYGVSSLIDSSSKVSWQGCFNDPKYSSCVTKIQASRVIPLDGEDLKVIDVDGNSHQVEVLNSMKSTLMNIRKGDIVLAIDDANGSGRRLKAIGLLQ